ncbi:glycoside hydrolase family 43 protein [Sphingomonas yunnanensis]|uniref:glycoside hydrolase family 43 protein n=1 Tax=Sphingomonas yunnanensis TaxID=310400 RepID=UPI001CA624C4|nr:glycoside hydrolase family 43 protein [Sphingomonas yunnanensis]MBY9064869.1 glycoside hydrolase family 43 protein [Sphingomonas yunnanensis]
MSPAPRSLAVAVASFAAAPAPYVEQRPLLDSAPDPYVVVHGGWYYMMATRGDRLAIRRTRDLAHLADATEETVWQPPAAGANARSIWAPELHRLNGRWYIYYTAADSAHDDDAHRGVFVLENRASDPRAGRWVDRGRVKTRLSGLDGTVFTARGRSWFVYSAYDGPDSVLAIAAIRNPWTLTGPERVIARPDRSWERQGGRQILEGPAFLRGPRGDLFLSYSGSACWSHGYAVGLLRADAGADLLDPRSWSKAARPILASNPGAHVFAPGHNAFFEPRRGETWIVYHANRAAGQGCTAGRAPHVARVRWSATGVPQVPLTAIELPAPLGD